MSGDTITVEILDTATGERAWVEERSIPFWWHEGNGGCDCNRRLLAFPENEDDGEEGYCSGCHRYLIVATEGDTEGRTLWDFNEDYPAELVEKHLGPKPPERSLVIWTPQ